MQRGTIFLILISLTILSTATSNAAAAVTLVEINPVSEKTYTPLFLFENISTVITGDPDNSITSAVPPTIKSYDVLEIDVPALQQQIQAGEKIPVRFRGISYLMALDRNPVVPESGESIYNGNFLDIPHEEIQDYLVRLSFSGDQFKGSVHDIRNGTFVYLIPVKNVQPAHTLYYVYSFADETPTGARLDNDVWVMLPSGESKLRNELTPEEIEWYKNEQVNREQLRLNETTAPPADISGQLPATAASLPLAVVTSTVPAGDSTLIIDIITPQENEFVLSDVVPHHIWVTGEVKSPVPLQSIIVSSSEGSINCGNQSPFGCDIVVAKGLDRIVVTVTDIAGNHVFRTRNIRVETGMPDLPLRITISGKITTPDGHPVEGATVRTEFPRPYDTKSVAVQSEADGTYRINNAHGFNQKISVEKIGYANITKEMIFTQNVNTADFILEPTPKPAPGFTIIICLVAVLGTLLIISRKRRTQ